MKTKIVVTLRGEEQVEMEVEHESDEDPSTSPRKTCGGRGFVVGYSPRGGSMTPERIEELMSAVHKAGPHIWGADQSFLLEALAIAKAAIPSGQVAEDVALLEREFVDGGADYAEHLRALQRLAAQAQSAQQHWNALCEQGADLAQEREWRQRAEALANENADKANHATREMREAMEGWDAATKERDAIKAQIANNGTYERGRELERTNWQNATGASTPRDATGLIATANAATANATKDRDSVKAALDMYSNAWKRELSGFLRPKGHEIDMLVVSTKDVVAKAKEADALRKSLADAQSDAAANAEEARILKERADRLSSAGQVLSEHVDKAPEPSACGHDLCEGVCTKYGPLGADLLERLKSEPSQPIRLMERDALSVRDECAKAALQGILANPTTIEKPDVCARAAYIAADAMLAARSNAVDITPEQEKAWETEARKDAAEQMRALACAAVAEVYKAFSGCVSLNDLTQAIQQARQ